MKTILFIFAMVAAFTFIGQAPVGAAIVHLDGIANAGWYADDKSKAHLYIYDLDTKQYVYQWVYGATPLPWSSRESLASDLADGEVMGKSVTNWQVQSAGDAFNNPANAIWKALNISAGTYNLKLTADSRAYHLNAFRWTPNDNGPELWNAYVQMYADYNDGTYGPFQFGDWPLFKETEVGLLSYYHNNVDGMQIIIPRSATMYFYINDYNSVDNDASVTLEFLPSAPLPGSLVLFGSGLLGLWAWRRR